MALNIGADDLVENPTPRVPVSLCIDTSGSMMGDKIRELIEGVNLFYDAIDEDDDAHDSAEVSIVAFNSGAALIQDFASIERLEPSTPSIAHAVVRPRGGRESRTRHSWRSASRSYSGAGVLYYQPWLVLMTDGQPNGAPQRWSARCSE